MCMGQVLQIPNFRPIFIREQTNKMYSPSAYFLATFLVTTMMFMFYPLIIGTICFFFIDFHDNSFSNYLDLMWTLVLTAFTGCSFGFMFGAIVRDERSGLQTAQMFTMMFSFGGGNFVNLGPGANWFVKFIGYVSPFRYTSERLMRTLLHKRAYVD